MIEIEEQIKKGLANSQKEKTFIDKILAKDDVDQMRLLIRKDRLTREDLLDILFLMTSTESKLLNYNDWERYIVLKFFVWIREFCKIAEQLYDYQEEMFKETNEDKEIKLQFDNNLRLVEHMIKFLIDLYLNIGHTTLSKDGMLILEIIRNKYELKYDYQGLHSTNPKEERKGLIT